MKIINALVMIVAAFFISACNSTNYASNEAEINAKQFETNENKATIYIFRDQTFAPSQITPVEIDGNFLASIDARTFAKKLVSPGKYTIISRVDSMPELVIDVKANEIYYVWQKVSADVFTPRTELLLVDEARGQQGVSLSRMLN